MPTHSIVAAMHKADRKRNSTLTVHAGGSSVASSSAGLIPYNASEQKLVDDLGIGYPELKHSKAYMSVNGGSPSSSSSASTSSRASPNHVSRWQWITVAILFFVNLINYMDRFTIAGVLSKIQDEYKIGDAYAGALSTAFVVSYMIFAPIFGYLGDRYSRKLAMAFGVLLWTIFTIVGSFMDSYWPFIVCRAMVGIGEASYSTIAPTIISDMFVKDMRSRMLALFYFAIPVGGGLGYVVSAETANAAGGDWRWGLRVTPILGIIAVLLILFLLVDPPRGESEGHGGELEATSYSQDLVSLAKNKSFVLSTLAFTCVTFCTGALAFWGPKFIENAIKQMEAASNQKSSLEVPNVGFVFGVVTMMSGIVGVPLGSLLSTKLKQRYPRADPIICGFGLLFSAVLIGAGLFTANWNIYVTFTLMFLGLVAVNLNWSIVADILLYVVVPTRRSTAEAVQILISHAFGDAGSPYLIGLVSDALRQSLPSTMCSAEEVALMAQSAANGTLTLCAHNVNYFSMQYSLFINPAVELLGAVAFFVTAVYIIRDKLKCERFIAGANSESVSTDDDDDIPPHLKPILSASSQEKVLEV